MLSPKVGNKVGTCTWTYNPIQHCAGASS
jgi:hypothetical protein